MEEQFENLSNSNATNYQALTSPGFAAFLIVYSIALAAVITFNGLIALVLLRATSVAITVRVPLINLLVAIICIAVMLLCGMLTSVVLALSDATESSLLLCRSGVWLYNVAVKARLLGLIVFSVMVFQTVACGMRKIRARWLILSLVVTWVIAILTSTNSLVPATVGVQYVGGVACLAVVGYPEYQAVTFTYAILWIIMACFVPLLMCICIPLGTLCYNKQHTISEGPGAQYKKALTKLAVFLISTNVLNVFDQVVLLIFYVIKLSHVWVYITYITGPLSFTSTPILIVVFLKPVRKRLRHLLCSKYWRDNETIPMEQADGP